MMIQVFKGLYENGSNNIHIGAHLAILTAIRDVCKPFVKELTSWVCYIEPFSYFLRCLICFG
jgi:CCR4-NOT transcription complex subunit 1